MKEAHGDPHAHAVRGLEGGDEALGSPLIAAFPPNPGGANQAGGRLYNERLLLSLVHRFGPLSKIEIARLTGCQCNRPPQL